MEHQTVKELFDCYGDPHKNKISNFCIHLRKPFSHSVNMTFLLFYRHAGVYTAEEVALITREKLIRLQSLYIDQFKRLQHLLKEKKRRYLHSRKVEHETLGTDGDVTLKRTHI